MFIFACMLTLAAAQAPGPERDDAFERLGLDADLATTLRGWRRPPLRMLEAAVPALAQRVAETPRQSAARAEAFVRRALAEIRPVPLLRAAASGLVAARREPEAKASVRMDVHKFEAVLERAHREILRALGSGRDPAMMAPVLQAAIERHLQPGALDQMTDAARAPLRTVLGRAAKVDIAALSAQAIAIVRAAQDLVADDAAALGRLPTKPGEAGVSGGVVLDRSTPFGRLVVGGVGRNEYECAQIAVIVDLGGDDEYRGPAGSAGLSRRMGLVVDVAGNDVYRSQNDGLGSATFGVGILLDLAGDDHYHGLARCAGFGAGGIGALFDLAGDDDYTFDRDSGGVGLLGLGLFLDAGAGKDITRAGSQALGCGLPGGVGFFVDDGGDDVRALRRGETASSEVCGVGLGVSGWLAGGVGLFVDVDGTDQYEAGDRACGVGVEGGVGIFFDAARDDRYVVGEFALGSGGDHGIGVFVDAAGDDEYRTLGPSLGCAIGHAVGWAEDRSGRDVYQLVSVWPGHADRGGLGLFLEFAGKDRYTLSLRELAADNATADKTIGLALFEDRGGEVDTYDTDDGVRSPRNGVVDRQVVKGEAGEVVRVLADQ